MTQCSFVLILPNNEGWWHLRYQLLRWCRIQVTGVRWGTKAVLNAGHHHVSYIDLRTLFNLMIDFGVIEICGVVLTIENLIRCIYYRSLWKKNWAVCAQRWFLIGWTESCLKKREINDFNLELSKNVNLTKAWDSKSNNFVIS